MKKLLTLLFTAAIAFSLSLPVFAKDTGTQAPKAPKKATSKTKKSKVPATKKAPAQDTEKAPKQ